MATIKYKDKNGEWKELTVLKGDSGVAPIINPDTNTWLVWDNERGVYVDTGVVAGVGTEDFYASTYWVFNEIASGKKVIAKALTDRRYPTNNDESFVDMAQKITDMNYEECWFAKIGYTKDNDGGIQEAINYSYELAKGWNPDGSTAQMFRGNTTLIFLPTIDTSNVTNATNMFYGCKNLVILPNLNFANIKNVDAMFCYCSKLIQLPLLDLRYCNTLSNFCTECSSLHYVPSLNTEKVANFYYAFAKCSSLRRIESIDVSSVTNYLETAFSNAPLVFLLMKNIGKSKNYTTYNFNTLTEWGTGGEENRQSLIDSLITYSYDRASAGMSTATIKLSTNTKALLTEEEIAQISAKGFTIS